MLIFVDCEAWGGAPSVGDLTEFGAVAYTKTKPWPTFHGVLVKSYPDPNNPAIPVPVYRATDDDRRRVFSAFESFLKPFGTVKFVSDNPAFDFQWINDGFFRALGYNPFGHSARRIGDYYAGLQGDFYCKQAWKGLRVTKHTHHPVDDAMGNAEAFERLQKGER